MQNNLPSSSTNSPNQPHSVIGPPPPVPGPSVPPAPPTLQQVSQTSGVGLGKEREMMSSVNEAPKIEEMLTDMELAPELADIGIALKSESVEIPPDLKQMGVHGVGPAQPLPQTQTVTLPLSNDQVMTGLHANILSSLRWLSEWCIKQLKKAHLHLVRTGDKILQQKD